MTWRCFKTLVGEAAGELELEVELEVCQGCILSPSLFNLYAQYIMRNARLDEAQVGTEIAGRNISNLRYADDTTLMAESKESDESERE